MESFKLDNEPKIKAGFIVPEHYFEDFSQKMLSQLPKEKVQIIPLFQTKRNLFLAIAAVFILALFIPIYNTFNINNTEIDNATLENHLTYQAEISSYELVSEIEDTDFNSIQIGSNLKDESVEDILTSNPDLEKLILE